MEPRKEIGLYNEDTKEEFITPLNDYLLLNPLVYPTVTKGGLIASSTKPVTLNGVLVPTENIRGKVIKKGPNVSDHIKEGDVVTVNQYSHSIEFNKCNPEEGVYYLVQEGMILCKNSY